MTKPLRGVTNEKWSELTTDSIQDLLKPLKVATKPDDGQLYFDFKPKFDIQLSVFSVVQHFAIFICCAVYYKLS